MLDEKQKEMLEWLSKLEQYAKEKQLSIRILDGIDECRKYVVLENADWDRISMRAEELLESVGMKAFPAVVQLGDGSGQVSMAAVENEMKNMAKRCHAENEASINVIENRKKIIFQELIVNLQDITRGKAHLDEMKNEICYQAFFQHVKMEYHNNVLSMVGELFQNIRSNHDRMMERMKSMLQSIKAYQHSLGNERIYRECDTKIAGLDSKIRNEIECLETGEEEILAFGQKTREAIRSIVKKIERKRKILAWLPIIVILCLFLTSVAGGYIMRSDISRKVDESTTEKGGITAEVIREIAGSVWQDYERFESGIEAVEKGLSGIIVCAIFLILVSVLTYMFYLWILKQWCDHQICNKCGIYLKAEMADFETNDVMLSRMGGIVNTVVEMYEQQYAMILGELLEGSDFDPKSKEKIEKERFAELVNSWNAIKYR